MKIGLLKCDTVRDSLIHISGDCSDFFIDLFSRHAPNVALTVYDVKGGQYPDSLAECDGYMTTGSGASVYDDEPWIHRLGEFVRELYAKRVKFVGVCFGHQMIAEALDGKCEKAECGWGIGVKRAEIVSKKSWMKPGLDAYSLIVSHLDQVVRLPEGSEVLAGSEYCPNSMFVVGDHFLGIQGHPEFSVAYADALYLARIEKIGQYEVEKARQSLKKEQASAEIITRWIENFIFRQA